MTITDILSFHIFINYCIDFNTSNSFVWVDMIGVLICLCVNLWMKTSNSASHHYSNNVCYLITFNLYQLNKKCYLPLYTLVSKLQQINLRQWGEKILKINSKNEIANESWSAAAGNAQGEATFPASWSSCPPLFTGGNEKVNKEKSKFR